MKILVLMIALGCLATPASAQTSAYKTGENIRGQVKDCFYSALGHEYVYSIGAYSLCPLSMPVSIAPAPVAIPATAFKTGENTRGQVKDCFYSLFGQRYVKSISSFEWCPMSVSVP